MKWIRKLFQMNGRPQNFRKVNLKAESAKNPPKSVKQAI